MAKKTVIKKEKVEEKEICTSETEVSRLDAVIKKISQRADHIKQIEQRIDRIVAALSKSKSVKGL